MTESEWQTGSSLAAMLAHVRARTSPRKLRLFACACVRLVWPLLIDETSQKAVEAAEQFADGLIGAADLALTEVAAFDIATMADLRTTVSDPGWAATRAAARSANLDPFTAASGAAFAASLAAAPWTFDSTGSVINRGDPVDKESIYLTQCDLLREIVGNPFQPVSLESARLAWDHAVIPRLAHDIYHTRRFRELSVLADALDDAGFPPGALIEHLRQPAGHTRGCWALDLLLGRS
ncbi:MAG: hypothetical protein U0840_28250 [Gemmataceae bacterium]